MLRTPDEERKAFALAAKLGIVFESGYIHRREWWLPHLDHLDGDKLFRIEWLEGSGCSFKPYRAYRILLDESNIRYLFR